jgi:hypothetical protein
MPQNIPYQMRARESVAYYHNFQLQKGFFKKFLKTLHVLVYK